MRSFGIVFLFCFISIGLNAQDMLTKRNGETIKAKVIEVTDYAVKYKRWDDRKKKGTLHTTSKMNLSSITYKNGEVEKFNKTITAGVSEASADYKTTTFTTDKTTHNFGKVLPEEANKTTFTITNTGDAPLIIENAIGSCGCTVPNYPKEPILPGKTANIEVTFTAKKAQKGLQKKTVSITANTLPKNTQLSIEAEVIQED